MIALSKLIRLRGALVASVVAGLTVAWGYLCAIGGGGLIPVQGKAGIGLAEYMGGSYAAFAASTATSLAGSGAIFALLVCIRWIQAMRYDRDTHPHFGLLLRKAMRHPTFLLSGVPGALYMTVYQGAIDLAGIPLAMFGGMCGIIGFPIAKSYRALRRQGMSRRAAFKQLRRRIKGIMYMLLATACAGGIYVYTSPDAVGDSAGSALVMIAFGAGIAWQFGILADMQEVSSSVLSAALMSSISGFVIAVITTGVLVGLGYGVVLRWPTQIGDLWVYGNAASGVGIIGLGTFAAMKIGKPKQVFLMALGSLTTSLLFATTADSGVVIGLQILAGILGVRGAYLCVIEAKKKQPNSLKTAVPSP